MRLILRGCGKEKREEREEIIIVGRAIIDVRETRGDITWMGRREWSKLLWGIKDYSIGHSYIREEKETIERSH